MNKYIVKTSSQNQPAANFRAANEIANKLAADGVEFGIWNVLDNDWCDDKRPAPAPAVAYKKPATKKHFCSSCKRGGDKIEADVYVWGKIETSGGRMMPYKAYLCSEHHDLMGDTENDGHLKVKAV